ncbi:MAG: tol-pal system-associated acyl-CoA thioesterase [Porticoccaceae bacterium]|nr:MAG: tol-pal system-associated acyl-CoA thioesterase [Porticoccaceae bacterium]
MAHAEFWLPVRVYVEDTDAAGVVFYANYLRYLERARTEWFRTLGFARPALFADRLAFVVRALEIRYLRPARLDDLLQVGVAVVDLGRARLRLDQPVLRDGERLCEAAVELACLRRDTLRPVAIPAEVRRALARRPSGGRGIAGRGEVS